MSLTGEGLKKYAISMIGTPYVYGAKIQDGVLTQHKVNTLASMYPKMFTNRYLQKIKDRGYIGKLCTDCSGLISGYTNKILGSSQMYSKAYKRIPYSDYKNFPIGTVLWRNGHVGVFCGQNSKGQYYCVEAKGIDYGTIASVLKSNSNWSYGLLFDNISYNGELAYIDTIVKSNPYTKPAGTIKLGSKGNGARWVQYELIESGYGNEFTFEGKKYSGVKIDGEIGPISEAAIKSFQASCKIIVDGKCGRITKQCLLDEF